ncbi:protein LSM12 homolog [Neodiprion virginianus]|uniref:protein LSM12 homolog n=1 Tax=Neodiprion fabricii TaxID=2872261 RepID=UPI001ED909AD|nr:protein LSM12 homolog [Neodiprion fabricii]XP_046617959.1 protein LSM12 homolog [Neodiprion virginianus]
MAGVSDWFSIGSTVACKTCYNKEIEGEVLAFDPQTKMLILKCPATCGRMSLNDVHIVNLSLVSDVQVKREVSPTGGDPPQSLNLRRLNTRVRNHVEEKKRMVKALQAGVSPDGQKLFIAIAKTIQDITWSGPNIIVWKSVTIAPPYTLENIHGDEESKAYTHVRKVVEKYVKDSAVAESHQQTAQKSASLQ